MSETPICFSCYWQDYNKTQFLKDVLGDCGIQMKSIWCGATDRPEDVRWRTCNIADERKQDGR